MDFRSTFRVRSRACAGAIALAALGCDLPAQAASCRMAGTRALIPALREASGAAVGRRASGVLWSHNDGGEPVILALDTLGAVRATLWVAAAQVVNWEDIGIGPCPTGSCLYVADIGDNSAKRREIVVYRFTEPALQDKSTRDAEAFRAVYPAGAHDAEAIFVAPDGSVYVVTKGSTGGIVLFRFPMPLRTGLSMRLEQVATIAPKRVGRSRWVTGAATSPDGQWIVLRSPGALAFYRAERLTKGIVSQPLVVDIRGAREIQGEGVAMGANGAVYLLGEGGGKGRPGTFNRLQCRLPN
jgi:hypothetical protein